MDTLDTVVCFDLFHTLITPVASRGASYEDVLVRLGAPRDRVYPFVRARLMTADMTIEEMVAALFREFGFSPEREAVAFDAAVAGWKEDNDCRWIEGAAELVAELAAEPSFAVCLVSNATRPGWEAVDRRLSVGRRFHAMHLSWQQGSAKPDPRCWSGILRDLGARSLPLSQCWMVGDNQVDDLDPPARMGWNTFLAAKDGSNMARLREQLLNPA